MRMRYIHTNNIDEMSATKNLNSTTFGYVFLSYMTELSFAKQNSQSA